MQTKIWGQENNILWKWALSKKCELSQRNPPSENTVK